MNINATLLGQMITFGILVWFTMRFVWPPILSALNARQKRIADGIAAAEEGQQELVMAQKKTEEMIEAAKKKGADIIEQAHKKADQVIEEAKHLAKQEGERLVASAKSDAAKAYQHAKEELHGQVVALVLVGVEKILERSVNRESHHEILDKLLSDLRSQKAGVV